MKQRPKASAVKTAAIMQLPQAAVLRESFVGEQ